MKSVKNFFGIKGQTLGMDKGYILHQVVRRDRIVEAVLKRADYGYLLPTFMRNPISFSGKLKGAHNLQSSPYIHETLFSILPSLFFSLLLLLFPNSRELLLCRIMSFKPMTAYISTKGIFMTFPTVQATYWST